MSFASPGARAAAGQQTGHLTVTTATVFWQWDDEARELGVQAWK
jgi:hypothetical protein